MRVPSATDFFFVKASRVAGIVDGSAQVVLENHGVQHDTEVFLVKLVDGLFGIGKDALIPGKGTVLGVPAGRTKSCAEIDERVARKLSLAKSFGFGNDFFVARQSAVRLLVAERPERRQFRMAGEPSVFGHQNFWFLRNQDENVEWQRAGGIFG